ncbi:MAG: 23S rRNA (pseudouridine(1915)-N(3))-methyltransferase RlmH [Alphaproteobacteria bacterium]
MIIDCHILLFAKSVDMARQVAAYQKKMIAGLTITTLPAFSHLNRVEQVKKQKMALEKFLSAQKKLQNIALVALDQCGKKLTSIEFAHRLAIWQQQYQKIYFIIGGANGFDKTFLKQCHQVISFGNMTFPHQFMPLLLAEQIFRADSILRGTPYHQSH